MRSILLLLCCAFAAVLSAGKHADTVKDLGDATKRPRAVETLAKAGAEAYDDLVDGLKSNPKDADATKAAANSQIRVSCARLLGLLGDSRASAELLLLLKEEATETAAYPDFAGTCAASLGLIWAVKPVDGTRTEVVNELKRIAAYEKISTVIKYGCLRGLASLREGAELAAPLVKEGELLIRSAAIGVVVACGHKASADDLLAIWTAQRGGEAIKYTEPLGLQALFGLATLADVRAVDGLVDVATRNEFSLMPGIRDNSVNMLQVGALRKPALDALKATLKADDKPTQWRQAAITLGELGAEGIEAFLAVSDEPAPEGKEADWFKKRVDDQLTALTSDTALKAFVGAYDRIPATEAKKGLRDKVLDQLLRYRTSLKEDGLALFRKAADDATLEAPKRAQCINAYCESKGKDSLVDLTNWVKSEDAVIRAQAVQNLGRSYIPIAKAQPLLVDALKSPGADFGKVRMNALQGLQRSDDKALLQNFLDSMDPAKEENAETRKEAIVSIQSYRRVAKIKEEDIFDAIKARTADADANVRAAAVGGTVGMAQRLGRKNLVVEVLEKALTDSSKDVRMQAYGQLGMAAGDMKVEKVLDAALKETETDAKGDAISALSRMTGMKDVGTDEKRLEALVDLAVGVAEAQAHRAPAARELLNKLVTEASAFTVVSRKVMAAVDRNNSGTDKRLDRVAQLLPVLTDIKEYDAVPKAKKLAEEPNVELRMACVTLIGELGTKDDIAFLRALRDRADNTAVHARASIEDAIRKLEER